MITIHRDTAWCATGPSETSGTATLEVRSDAPGALFLSVGSDIQIRLDRAELKAKLEALEGAEPIPLADPLLATGIPMLVGDESAVAVMAGEMIVPSEDSTIL